MAEALARCRSRRLTLQINNRKLIQGFYLGLGVADPTAVIAVVDKLDKVPADKVRRAARHRRRARRRAGRSGASRWRRSESPTPRSSSRCGRSASSTSCSTRGWPSSPRSSRAARPAVDRRRRSRPTCASPAASTTTPARSSRSSWPATSGSESICSGGRYDPLASDGRTTYPGVGISLGVSPPRSSRCSPTASVAGTARCRAPCSSPSPTRSRARRATPIATALRARGIPTEVAPSAQKFGKQIRYAERRGIPFVWFPAPTAATRSRTSARAIRWPPTRRPGPHPTEDLRPQIDQQRGATP